MKTTKASLIIGCTAILCLSALTAYALYLGMNVAILTLAFTMIGGLAGYKVRKP